MPRHLLSPPLKLSFETVFQAISDQPGGNTPKLQTTGGKPFVAHAKASADGRRFISLPHSNRIYEGDWGYNVNSMGNNDGQRIGHYAMPIDEWARLLGRGCGTRGVNSA
jgi:hypothetical protein